MLGFQIFKHSIIQVLGNWQNALRISGALWLIVAVILPMIIRMLLTGSPILDAETVLDGFGNGGGSVFFAIFISIILSWVAVSWIAVAWHRYVLKNEMELSVLYIPKTSGGAIAGYMWKGIVLGFVLFLIMIPIGIIFSGIGMLVNVEMLGAAAAFIPIFLGIVVTILMLRFSLILPARALNLPIGVGESWGFTSEIRSALWVTSIMLVVTNGFLNFILTSVLLGTVVSATILVVFSTVVNWMTMMIGVSILTTLYGICVENRELV